MSAEYEVWERDKPRDTSTLYESPRGHGGAAERWARENWPVDASDDDTVDVVIVKDGGKRAEVYTIEREVEYTAYDDLTLSDQVTAELFPVAPGESEQKP